jgi:hypothetical protein
VSARRLVQFPVENALDRAHAGVMQESEARASEGRGGPTGSTIAGPITTGRCTCRAIRYELTSAPLFIHCCHCRWCQRETGSAFVLNALIESDRVRLLEGAPEYVDTPSESGKGQRIARCSSCRVALWSHYGGVMAMSFVRVGTLDEPDRYPPDIHIYTASKQPWLALPAGVPAVPEYYRRSQYWPAASLARFQVLFPKP